MQKPLFLALLLVAGCSSSSTAPAPVTEGFALYLLADRLSPQDVEGIPVTALALEADPVLALDDIVSYARETHEIELTDAAYARIAALQVPVSGLAFVVRAGGERVYNGAFWVPISSLSHDGLVIETTPAAQQLPLRIQLCYPESLDLFTGEDLRGDARILQVLENAGKLRPTPLHSMKGWELYSWLEADDWRFALVPGTNRLKTREEVVAAGVPGIQEIVQALVNLARGEEVFWSTQRVPDTTMPPDDLVASIEARCEDMGLQLQFDR